MKNLVKTNNMKNWKIGKLLTFDDGYAKYDKLYLRARSFLKSRLLPACLCILYLPMGKWLMLSKKQAIVTLFSIKSCCVASLKPWSNMIKFGYFRIKVTFVTTHFSSREGWAWLHVNHLKPLFFRWANWLNLLEFTVETTNWKINSHNIKIKFIKRIKSKNNK